MIIHVSYAYHILRDLMDGDSLRSQAEYKNFPSFRIFLILKMRAEQLN